MLSLIFSLLIFSPSWAVKAEGARAANWDFETRNISRKYRKEGLPTVSVDAWWAGSSGALASPRAWRHALAMVVAAFYAERRDQREAALEWLKAYECENVIACDDIRHHLGKAIVESKTVSRHPELKASALSIKKALDSRAAIALKRKPPTTGLCAPHADRAGWLELEYELFCPPPGTSRRQGLCPGCQLTRDLEFQLGLDSQQMVMSSSFVKRFEHRGGAACSRPWKAWIQCGGGITASYLVDCERKGGGVRCTEKRNNAKK